jgi:outer membrane biosynthesis protein TonB
MNARRALATLMVALPLSSFVAGCRDNGGDTADRKALEDQQTQRDLDLALQTDTTQQPRLADVPVTAPPQPQQAPAAQPDPQAPPVPAPSPVRRPTPPPPPRPRQPAPEPRQPEQAPQPSRPAGPSYVTRTAVSGTSFGVRIDDELSTARMQPGDVFTATLSEAITDPEGNVVIPAGATVYGRVTTSQVSRRGGESARIGVAFTSIAYGGDRYSIEGSTVIGEPAVRRVSRQSTAETAGKVAGGAAVGAIAGRVLGHGRGSTIAGAVIGAAAGTAVAAGTAQVDAIIPAGSSARIQIGHPVSVRRQTS